MLKQTETEAIICRNAAVGGVEIQEKIPAPSPSSVASTVKPPNSKPMTSGESSPLGTREGEEGAVQDSCVVLLDKNSKHDNCNAADVKMTLRSSEGEDANDTMSGNATTVDGDLSAKPLTSKSMTVGLPTSGDGDNGRQKISIDNSPFRSDPTTLVGASSSSSSSALEKRENTSATAQDARDLPNDTGNNNNMTARSIEGVSSAAQLQGMVLTREENDTIIFGNAITAGGSGEPSAKPPLTSDPVPLGSSTSGNHDDENNPLIIAQSSIHSDRNTIGESSALEAGGDQRAEKDIGAYTDEDSNNMSIQSQFNADANEEEENIGKPSETILGNAIMVGGCGQSANPPLTSEPTPLVSSTSGTSNNEINLHIIPISSIRLEPTASGAPSTHVDGVDESVVNDAGAHSSESDNNNISIQLQVSTDAKKEEENMGEPPPVASTGTSSTLETTGDKVKDAGVHLDGGSNNISIQLQETSTDANKAKRNSMGKPPLKAAIRSVRFASTNKVRQFDGDCAVSTLLQEKEGQAELRNKAGKVVRRRKTVRHGARSNTRTSTGARNAVAKTRDRVCMSQDSLVGITSTPTHPVYSDNADLPHRPVHKKSIQIALIHSHLHTQIIHQAMEYIHQDRDVLLESLMKWCGIFHGATGTGGVLSSFLTIVPPKMGTRKLLEKFHDTDYLELLQFPPIKSVHGLVEENNDAMKQNWDKSVNDGRDSSSDMIDIEGQSKSAGDGTCIESFEERTSLPYEESSIPLPSDEILSKYGLEDDCPFPTTFQAHALLWKYCLAISGASWHAASLLTANESTNQTDVAIHWGGGRHHAHRNKAGGFCYVSDVVLAIHRLLLGHDNQIDVGVLEDHNYDAKSVSIHRNLSFRRVLYIDVDIHHADAVQTAFYSTDRVLTASFHRHSPGFFPATSGSINEKGEVGTSGLGYNLNVPLPAGIGDVQFLQIYRKTLFGLVKAYNPHALVLCVGADGLEGDELVSGSLGVDDATGEGWALSPEGLAECVRIAAALCAGLYEDDICASLMEKQEEKKASASSEAGNSNGIDTDNAPCAKDVKSEKPKRGNRRKLLILGGGGYTPAQTSRTYLLCSAAACEGARPGMLWSDLPRDIPSHDYFPRYGPMFELVSEQKKTQIFTSYSSVKTDTSPVKESCGDEIEMCPEVIDSDRQVLRESKRAIELATLYIDRQREGGAPQKNTFCFDAVMDKDEDMLEVSQRRKKSAKSRRGRRHKRKRP